MRTWTPKFTRKWASALTAVAVAASFGALSVAPGVTADPAAQAATVYPPGGPDQTPVMGWSGWSFLRLGADTAQVEGEASALVSTSPESVLTVRSETATVSLRYWALPPMPR